MKIRTDFVTNSSSSSFILLGVSFDRKYNTKENRIYFAEKIFEAKNTEEDGMYDLFAGVNKKNLEYVDDEEMGAPKDKCLMGIRYRIDDDCEDVEEIDIDGHIPTLSEMTLKLNQIHVPHSQTKIFIGRMMT